jgi:hypothetical protein
MADMSLREEPELVAEVLAVGGGGGGKTVAADTGGITGSKCDFRFNSITIITIGELEIRFGDAGDTEAVDKDEVEETSGLDEALRFLRLFGVDGIVHVS